MKWNEILLYYKIKKYNNVLYIHDCPYYIYMKLVKLP